MQLSGIWKFSGLRENPLDDLVIRGLLLCHFGEKHNSGCLVAQMCPGYLHPQVKWRVEISWMFCGGFVRFRIAGTVVRKANKLKKPAYKD